MRRLLLTAAALLALFTTGHAVIAAGERELVLLQLQSLASALRTQGHTMTWGEVRAGGLTGPGATVSDVLVKTGTGDLRILAKTVAFSGLESLKASDIGVEITTKRLAVPFLGSDDVSGQGSIAELTIDKPDFVAIATLFATKPVQPGMPFQALNALSSERLRVKDLTFEGRLGPTGSSGRGGSAGPGDFQVTLADLDLQGLHGRRFRLLRLSGWTMAAEQHPPLGPVRTAIGGFLVTDGDMSRSIAAYEKGPAMADLLELVLGFGYRNGEMTDFVHEDQWVTTTTEKVTWNTEPSPLAGFTRVVIDNPRSVTVPRDGSERLVTSSQGHMDFDLDRREVALSFQFLGDDWFNLLADAHLSDIPSLPANDPLGLESQANSGQPFPAPRNPSEGPAIIENWRGIIQTNGGPNPVFELASALMQAYAQKAQSGSVTQAAEAVQAFAREGGELQTEIRGPVALTSDTLLRALDSSRITIRRLVAN